MKKFILLVLSLAMLFSLCACGSSTPNESADISPEKAIVGKWCYNTGITTWNFIFNEDGSCSYWSGNKESTQTTYIIENDKIHIADLDNWDFSYTITEGKFELLVTQESGNIWRFTKDNTYDPSAITTLELTDEMIDEIEAKINDKDFIILYLATQQLTFKSDEDLTFTDLEIASQKKTSQYTYTVFGTIYAKDNYNKKYRQNVNIVFTAVEDNKEDTGYSIKWNSEFVVDDK